MNDRTKPGPRRIHHWIGRDREKDIAELTTAIAENVELYNQDEVLVRLDEDGKIIPINLADLRELIGEQIAGVRVLARNGVARKEIFSYRFDTRPHPRPRTAQEGLQRGETRTAEPDAKVLEEIYLQRLLPLVPRVIAG